VSLAILILFWPVLSDAANLKACSLFIAAKANPLLRARLYESIDRAAKTIVPLYAIDLPRFVGTYPPEKAFDLVVWEMFETGGVNLRALYSGDEVSEGIIDEATRTVVTDLIRKDYYSIPGEFPLPFSTRPFSYDVSGSARKDFTRWTYGEYLTLVRPIIPDALAQFAEDFSLPVDQVMALYSESQILDEMLHDLYVGYVNHPRKFLGGGEFGLSVPGWARTSAVSLAINRAPIPKWDPLEPDENHPGLADKMRVLGLDRPPMNLNWFPNDFLPRAYEALDIFVGDLARSRDLDPQRLLTTDDPESLCDLRRETLFEALKSVVSGYPLGEPATIRRVAQSTAEQILARHQVIQKEFDFSDLHGELGGELDDAITQSNLFFFVRYPAAESRALFERVRETLTRGLLQRDQEVSDAILLNCWRRIDTELALIWTHRPRNELPLIDDIQPVIDKQVRRSIGFPTRLAEMAATSERITEDGAETFWRYLARKAEDTVVYFAPFYSLTPQDFWKAYSEAQVLDALGREAQDWIAKGYGKAADLTDARLVTNRAIRSLLAQLARKDNVPVPEDWVERVRTARTDTLAIFDLVAPEETATILRIWEGLDEQETHRNNFIERYLNRVPPSTQKLTAGPERHAQLDFVYFMDIRELITLRRDLVKRVGVEGVIELLKMFDSQTRELTLLYTSRARPLSYFSLAKALEARAASGVAFEGLAREAWPDFIRREVRQLIDEEFVAKFTAESGAKPGRRKTAAEQTIPAGMVVAPASNEFTDEFWQLVSLRIEPAVAAAGRRFKITPKEFWKDQGGRYTPKDVLKSLVDRADAWKKRKLTELKTANEANELAATSIRNLMIPLFHELKRPYPAHFKSLKGGDRPFDNELVMMIPRDELSVALSAWKLGTSKWNASHWAEDPIEQALDRVKMYQDYFVEGMPTRLIEKAYQIPEGVTISSRLRKFAESIQEFWELSKDPANHILILSPPEKYGQHVTYWMMTRAELTALINRLPGYGAGNREAWNAFATRYPAAELATVLRAQIESAPPTGTHWAARRHEASEAAFDVAWKLLPEARAALQPLRPRKRRGSTVVRVPLVPPLVPTLPRLEIIPEPESPPWAPEHPYGITLEPVTGLDVNLLVRNEPSSESEIVVKPVTVPEPVAAPEPIAPPVPDPFANWRERVRGGETAEAIVAAIPRDVVLARVRAWRRSLSSPAQPDIFVETYVNRIPAAGDTRRQLMSYAAFQAFAKFNQSYVERE